MGLDLAAAGLARVTQVTTGRAGYAPGDLLKFFFFSSRRRHTRYWRDWSSDVCSSDLRSGGEHAERGRCLGVGRRRADRSEEHTSELQSRQYLVCRLLLEKKKILSEMQQLPKVCAAAIDFGKAAVFTPGSTYADYDKSVDFFFNDAAAAVIDALSLHDALPI